MRTLNLNNSQTNIQTIYIFFFEHSSVIRTPTWNHGVISLSDHHLDLFSIVIRVPPVMSAFQLQCYLLISPFVSIPFICMCVTMHLHPQLVCGSSELNGKEFWDLPEGRFMSSPGQRWTSQQAKEVLSLAGSV